MQDQSQSTGSLVLPRVRPECPECPQYCVLNVSYRAHLSPLLSEGGSLIIYDYGTWEGARQAVDRYFAENYITMLLYRIDEGARIGLELQ